MPASQVDTLPSGVTAHAHSALNLRGFPGPVDVVQLSGHISNDGRNDTGELVDALPVRRLIAPGRTTREPRREPVARRRLRDPLRRRPPADRPTRAARRSAAGRLGDPPAQGRRVERRAGRVVSPRARRRRRRRGSGLAGVVRSHGSCAGLVPRRAQLPGLASHRAVLAPLGRRGDRGLRRARRGLVPLRRPGRAGRRTRPATTRRHQEAIANLVAAWRDTWRLLRGGPPVATSLAVFGPKVANDWWATTWLEGFRDGMLLVPGRGQRELPDLRGRLRHRRPAPRRGRHGAALEGEILGLLRAGRRDPARPSARRRPARRQRARSPTSRACCSRRASGVINDAAGTNLGAGVHPVRSPLHERPRPAPTLTAWA